MVLDTIETKTTSLTSRLQRCDPQTAQDTTFPASFVKILLFHKGWKQKLLHFQRKVNKDRDHKQRVQGRIYKHMTHKWHRRQRLLLHMGKYYCSIKARSRNSFTVSKELKTIGTKSKRLTSRLQRCDRKKAKETTSHASFGETLLLHKGEKQKLLHFQNKVSKDRLQATSSMPNLQTCDLQTAQDTTFAASFVEILLLHKGEKQKLLY